MVAGRNSVRTFGDRTHGPIWSTLILGTGNALAGHALSLREGVPSPPPKTPKGTLATSKKK